MRPVIMVPSCSCSADAGPSVSSAFARAGRHGWPDRFADRAADALAAPSLPTRDYLLRAKAAGIRLAAVQLVDELPRSAIGKIETAMTEAKRERSSWIGDAPSERTPRVLWRVRNDAVTVERALDAEHRAALLGEMTDEVAAAVVNSTLTMTCQACTAPEKVTTVSASATTCPRSSP